MNKSELDAALDEGELSELPPNRPKGLLGEKNPNLYAVDDFEPDLSAGVSQENDVPVVWLAVVLAYLLFFPLAYVILWRSQQFTRKTKVVVSVIGAVGVLATAWWLWAY